MLTQQINTLFEQPRRVLLAGCGGGYDVFGAVPLMAELLEGGHEVTLASHSFCYLNGLAGAIQHPSIPNLYEVPATAATRDAYCPEAWLARWQQERLGRQQSVWAFDKTGVQPLHAAYRHLVERLQIDSVVLVDGGIDAMLRGDESSLGTPAEDLVSIAAVDRLELPVKVLACFALGAEIRDGICHEQVFGRIAELNREQGFLGATALLPQTGSGKLYLDALEYTFSHQEGQRTSHINKVVRDSLSGQSGSRGPHIWISPLLSMFWFFSLRAVAGSHLFLSELWDTTTIWEVSARIEGIRKGMKIRERSSIPI